MTDSSNHSRNLKTISIFFILYWLLDLTPTGDDQIRLQFISYEIHNSSPLTTVSWVLLAYFGWRFYLSSKSNFSEKVIKPIKKIQSDKISNIFIKKNILKEKIKEKATKIYREEYAEKQAEKRNKSQSRINNPSHQYNIEVFNQVEGIFSNKIQCIAKYSFNHLPGLEDKHFLIPLNIVKELPFIKVRAWFSFIRTSEDSIEYLLPYFLLCLAVLCAILIQFDISPNLLQDKVTSFLNRITR
ncbi:hypothetical protein [Marinomonas posidonica]|uniref:hypothetical protein n=1 Tax=Marinomonas posidonica TaxID=936476 RepID=UPI003736143F